MKGKYYTPEAGELTIGMEVELLHSTNGWVKYINPDIKPLDANSLKEGVRVKFLDREDIESLGWKLQYSENTMWDYYKKEGTDNVLYHDKKDLITNGVWIKWMNHNNSQWHPSRYMLKNKTELNKLMKFKGI